MRAAIALALLAWLSLAAPGRAQDWAAAFNDYLTGAEYLDQVGNQIDLVERQIAPECIHVLTDAERIEVRVRRIPGFDAARSWPVSGQWRERLAIDRCGTEVLHNLLVTARADQPPHITVLLPGDSLATPELQVAAARPAVAIAEARHGRQCATAAREIVNARFDRWLGTGEAVAAADRRWREVWTVRLCDRIVQVAVVFQPDGKGGFTHIVDVAE